MPYSNYTKIHDLLTRLSAEPAPLEINDLAEVIRSEEIESFAIFRPGDGPGTPSEKTMCSAAAIRRIVRFTADLGFIEIGTGRLCRVTGFGRNALQEGNYNHALATHVTMYLNENAGMSFTDLKDTITAIRRPDIPFFETIYKRLKAERELTITQSRLRMLMYLLERCEQLTATVRKVYSVPETEE